MKANPWLTGLEPSPLHRHRNVGEEMASVLDTTMCIGNEVLERCMPINYGMSLYHVYSPCLFYEDGERDGCNPAGFQVMYASREGGKPSVHQYREEQMVCWSGKDHHRAEVLRSEEGLCRYNLFQRVTNLERGYISYAWEFQHAGQLVLVRKEKEHGHWL